MSVLLEYFSNYLYLFILILLAVFMYILLRRMNVNYYVYPSELDHNFVTQTIRIMSNSNWNKKYNIKNVASPEMADILIHLTPRSEMDKWHTTPEYYPGTNKQIRFSITVQHAKMKPEIFIDSENWLNGVPESGLSLDKYRSYVIQHEFGHGLGYDHDECAENTGICPVMYQATRGCGKGNVCGFKVSKRDLNGNRMDVSYL